jgi:hypothetical protein
MEKTKQILFAAISSLLVILGLGFLSFFGVTLSYVPVLFSAALIGILILVLGGKNAPAYVLLASLAGFAGAIVLVKNANANMLASPALVTAFCIALPAIMIWLRESIFKK